MSPWDPFAAPIQDPGAIRFVIPAGWKHDAGDTGRCRSCRAPIAWCTNAMSGRRLPVNPDGVSHFATCPDAGTWRKPKARETPSGS